jgi:hypothetical protein
MAKYSQIGGDLILSWVLERKPVRIVRPYYMDLREQVVLQMAGGMSCREVAHLNNIALRRQ